MILDLIASKLIGSIMEIGKKILSGSCKVDVVHVVKFHEYLD